MWFVFKKNQLATMVECNVYILCDMHRKREWKGNEILGSCLKCKMMQKGDVKLNDKYVLVLSL